MAPGELFVHRNIANLVHNIDVNLMSVLEFAINVLKVRHVMVVGHYGCGGVRAAVERQEFGLIDNWLRKIKDVYAANKEALDSESDPEKRLNLLCEINVRQQVLNICHTSIVQNAWREGRELAVHAARARNAAASCGSDRGSRPCRCRRRHQWSPAYKAGGRWWCRPPAR